LACRQRARQLSVREAGRRYQTSLDGRHAHAARQRRYAERQKVTHHSPLPAAGAVRVRAALDGLVMTAMPEASAKAKSTHEYEKSPTCRICGATSSFTRHETLARFRRRWRHRRPP
jgi:hypothetical protein